MQKENKYLKLSSLSRACPDLLITNTAKCRHIDFVHAITISPKDIMNLLAGLLHNTMPQRRQAAAELLPACAAH
jgi:hypothetical protein